MKLSLSQPMAPVLKLMLSITFEISSSQTPSLSLLPNCSQSEPRPPIYQSKCSNVPIQNILSLCLCNSIVFFNYSFSYSKDSNLFSNVCIQFFFLFLDSRWNTAFLSLFLSAVVMALFFFPLLAALLLLGSSPLFPPLSFASSRDESEKSSFSNYLVFLLMPWFFGY